MGFPDFPIPEQDKSYVPAEDVLQFLNAYADHFGIKQFIKVQRIQRFVDVYQYICYLDTSNPKVQVLTHTFLAFTFFFNFTVI